MKAWIVSDLHYDHGGAWLEPPTDADIAIVAGDACDDAWLGATAAKLPTVFVAGNHEFYGWDYQERLDKLSAVAGLHFLNDGAIEIGGVRIAGATLWTDYGQNPVAAEVARREMNDHRYIKWAGGGFLPSHATALHAKSVQFLSSCDADIIVTHHAPSDRSVHERYAGSLLNRAYYSDLDEVAAYSGAELWVHGHVHTTFDYMIGDTRVLCNPCGYPSEQSGFNPNLMVEI